MNRLKKKVIEIIANRFQSMRILIFKQLSNNNYFGNPIINIPLQTVGLGKIYFGENVMLGFSPSPFFYNGVTYIESRNIDAVIKIGNNVFINNNFVIICDKTLIEIGDNTLIGPNVEIINSDFHEIDPYNRNSGNHECKPVIIKKNVFIGSNVKILKGAVIGDNSVIANSSVVIGSVPENVVFGGVPAKFIRNL